tara:strand:- start:50 stop:580 length:531 start_codon:yes stop_codon:yes gene_type:complete
MVERIDWNNQIIAELQDRVSKNEFNPEYLNGLKIEEDGESKRVQDLFEECQVLAISARSVVDNIINSLAREILHHSCEKKGFRESHIVQDLVAELREASINTSKIDKKYLKSSTPKFIEFLDINISPKENFSEFLLSLEKRLQGFGGNSSSEVIEGRILAQFRTTKLKLISILELL